MVYYTGDIHGNVDEFAYSVEELGLNEGDTVVILGDAGINYYGDDFRDAYKKAVISKLPITVFCIHGNHEMRPESIPTYKTKEWNGGTVWYEEEFPHIYFAKDGEIFDLDGKKSVIIGGAYSVDKYYRLMMGYKWFPDEQPSKEIMTRVEKTLENRNWKIEQILTHTCPSKYIPTEAFIKGIEQNSVDRSTEEWLDTIENRLEYERWICGHWHIDKSIDKIRFIMNDYII